MTDEQTPNPAPESTEPVAANVDPSVPPEVHSAPAEAVTGPTQQTSPGSQGSSSGDPEQLASDFKKDELKTAAAVVGADVSSGATKADLAQAIVDTQSQAAPVNPDTDHSPPQVVGTGSNVAPAIAGSGSGAAPDQTSGTPLTGGETPGYVAPPSSTGTGGTGSSYTPPVTVDNRTRRSGDDALLGSWVDIVSGPNAGRFGSYVDTAHSDPETGYPTVIIVRSRDSRAELLEAAYEDVRPSESNGGR